MLSLSEQNEAVALQRKMQDDGFSVEFANVFSRCLPRATNGGTDKVDWDAVATIEAWALLHPNLRDALAFLRRVLDHRKYEWQALGLESKLSKPR